MQYNIMYRIMVVALCLLGFAGCSEEDMPVKNELGKTVLRVALGPKDIVLNDEGDVEKYVKTLHIIGIDQNNAKGIDEEVNLAEAEIHEESNGDKYAEFTIEEIPAGVYTLYSVANASSDLNWQTKLTSTTVDAYTSGEQPDLFLMSAIDNARIDPNNSNNGATIELKRTVAKIGVGTITMNGEEKTPTDYKIDVLGKLYSTYPLFEATNTSTGSEDINKTSTNAPVYLSESNGPVNVTLTVTIDGKEYTGTLADGEEDIVLKRNNYYALNGTIDAQSQCLLLNISVAPWEIVSLSPTYE